MRYRVFMMLVANSVAAQAQPAYAGRSVTGPERRARALQLDPKRALIDPSLLPFVADVAVIRASVLPPSDRIALHLALYDENDPNTSTEQTLHVRANTLWPVAKLRTSTGIITQVNVIADRRGRVKTEYRTEEPATPGGLLVAGQHGVTLDRADATTRGLELHGRAWHLSGEGRAFAALVRRKDVGYTFDLGKVAGHWVRMDVRGDTLLGLSAVSEG